MRVLHLLARPFFGYAPRSTLYRRSTSQLSGIQIRQLIFWCGFCDV